MHTRQWPCRGETEPNALSFSLSIADRRHLRIPKRHCCGRPGNGESYLDLKEKTGHTGGFTCNRRRSDQPRRRCEAAILAPMNATLSPIEK